jgi:hypothetical protein
MAGLSANLPSVLPPAADTLKRGFGVRPRMDAPSAAPQREPGCVPKAVIGILSGFLGRDDSGAQQTHLVVRLLRGSAFISETRVLGEVYEFLRKRNALIVHFSRRKDRVWSADTPRIRRTSFGTASGSGGTMRSAAIPLRAPDNARPPKGQWRESTVQFLVVPLPCSSIRHVDRAEVVDSPKLKFRTERCIRSRSQGSQEIDRSHDSVVGHFGSCVEAVCAIQ